MARYKNVEYSQTTLIPFNFNDQILPGTFEYVLDRLKLIGGKVFAVDGCKIP